MSSDLDLLLKDVAGVPVTTDPDRVRRASRDMSAVLSPALARSFAGRQAQAVAEPRNLEELTRVVASAARHRVPLIPRGAGTCNFGQSIPLRGGVVLDVRALSGVVLHEPGRWRAWTGTILSDIDDVLRPSGEEMRVFPSSKKIGTAGGYIVGGHAGIGAVRHGVLADEGNILGLQILTVTEEPELIEVRGDDVGLVHFSFGTAGLVTQVEMPTTTAWAWRDLALSFPDLARATAFGLAAMIADGIDIKNVHPVDEGMAAAFTPLALPAGRAAALVMVAPHSLEPLVALAARHGGDVVLEVSHGSGPRSIPFYEYTWGHSVWWLRKQQPGIATLMALLPESDPVGALEQLRHELDEPAWIAVSCKRFAGRPALQLALCVAGDDRLAAAAERASGLGCLVADTHRPVLSEGSIYAFAERQRAFKRSVDPYGLLNPGKLAGVDAGDEDTAMSGDLASQGFSARR